MNLQSVLKRKVRRENSILELSFLLSFFMKKLKYVGFTNDSYAIPTPVLMHLAFP